MKKFEVSNINCQNCANTIKNALKDDYGETEVDLSVQPRVVSVNLDDAKVENFKRDLADLGFGVIKEI